MQSNNRSFKLACVASAVCTALMGKVYAQAEQQGQQATEQEVEEVILVQGRGWQEALIEVPISETVFSESDLLDARVSRVDDFISLTPGITIANAQDSGTNFITIRGMSQTRNGEPPVAVIIDGVLQVNSRAFDQALYDVESIEVLRGPQGALYGRNATNGAIIIRTKAPADEFEGYAQGTFGKGGEVGFETSVSGPIDEDTTSFRFSARHTSLDGYYDNVATNDKVGFYDETNLRGHLNFLLGDELTLDVRASYTKSDGDALLYTFQGISTDPQTGEAIAPSAVIGANVVQRRFSANNKGIDQRDVGQLTVKLAYELDWGQFTSVTAYDWLEQQNGGDQFPYTANSTINPGKSFFDGTQTQYVDVKAFSQEFRLMSNDANKLRWMAGAYYLATDRYISSTTGADLEKGIVTVSDTPALGNPKNPTTSFLADDNNNTAWATFFNLAYDVNEQLELAFAGRYDKDEREQSVSKLNGFYAPNGNLLAPAGQPGAVNKATFSRFQPKISARYMLENGVAMYASWGRGFRSGQFNQNGVAQAAATAGVVGVKDVYQQENSETLEAGVKARFMNGKVTTNAALYRTDVENAPYFVFIGDVGAQVLVGIDEVQINGGEIEVDVNLADGLDFYAGLGVSSSDIQAYALNPTAVGNKAPYVPGMTLNTGLQYRTALTDNLGLFARADYEKRGKQYWDPENSTARPALDLINLRAGIEAADGSWSVMGSVQNLTDEEYNSEWVLGGFAHAGLPRIWRVDLRYNF